MERELFIRILKLESKLKRLEHNPALEETQRQLYSEQLKRVGFEEEAKQLRKQLNDKTLEHKEYTTSIIPLIKELTKRSDINAKKLAAVQTELVTVKRERDFAQHSANEIELKLQEEKKKRNCLRSSYRVLNLSFEEKDGGNVTPEVKVALNDMKKALIN